jgi:hypothetical protein
MTHPHVEARGPDFACDLAISAVASDAGIVAEFITEVAPRLRTLPLQSAYATSSGDAGWPLESGDVRVALIVHQHLWAHDERVQRDAALLRDRVRGRPASVCVITLDDAPIPSWLVPAARYDLAAAGRPGAVEFVVDAVAAAGGLVAPKREHVDHSQPVVRWPEPPTPYLSQPRAHSALRHELDKIIGELKPIIHRGRIAQPERTFELHVVPHRMVARLDDAAVSFSWLNGPMPLVADGRLMVIAWRDVARDVPGVAALKSAVQIHERIYAAEANAPDEWCWRATDVTAQPYSSSQLAAAWIARAGIARSA